MNKNELTLQCVVSGERPKITWFKDNYNISNNRYTPSEDYGGIRRLIISDPVPSDFGCFTCRSDDGGHIDEISLTVGGLTLLNGAARSASSVDPLDTRGRSRRRSLSKFHEKSVVRSVAESSVSGEQYLRDARRQPMFTTRLTDRTAAENTCIKLTCQINGTDVRAEWYRNKTERLDGEGDPNLVCRYREGLATLEVFCARPDDTGTYTCRAVNAYGEDNCTGYLRVFAGHDRRPMPPIFTRPVKGSIFGGLQKTRRKSLGSF